MPALLAPADHENPDKERLRQVGGKVRERLAANKAVQRIASDKGELWALGNFLDPIECGRLITLIDATARPSQAYHVDYSSGIRTSYSGDLDPRDPFIRKLETRFSRLLGIEPVYGETIQGQRYTAGQEFKQHIDWFTPDSVPWSIERDHGGQRNFTAMVYLNEVEEGGETDFPFLDLAIAPRRGTLVVWNNADENGVPNPWMIHAGNPVTRGFKYIITKWYRCRPWRPVSPPSATPPR
jgi:prolyl 4-hydroxylase